MSLINSEFPLPLRLAEAIANPLFPRIDTALRSGRHISADDFEQHSALVEFHGELEIFYGRYQVELIKAPEGFFYLRPRPSADIGTTGGSAGSDGLWNNNDFIVFIDQFFNGPASCR